MKKQKQNKTPKCFVYKAAPSALLQVPQTDKLPVDELQLGIDVATCVEIQAIDSDYLEDKAAASPILIPEVDLNPLAGNLSMSKRRAEI